MHIVAIVSIVASVAAHADSIPSGDYLRMSAGLVDTVVVPVYRDHAASTQTLADALSALCDAPDAAQLERARESFRRAQRAWQRAQPITFGPVSDGAGQARIEYWPDKRGTGARQLRRALASEDASLLDASALSFKSVALTDLQALEQVLFDDDSTLLERGGYRCRLALSIARHQSVLAQSISSEWTREGGYGFLVKSSQGGNDAYFDAKGAARDIFKSFTGTLLVIADVKLTRPLGDSIEDARGQRAESWRSAASLDNIVANLETLQQLFDSPQGLADLLRRVNAAPIADGVSQRLGAVLDSARAIPVPLATAVADPKHRGQVVALRDDIQSLLRATNEHVATALELSKGFNSTDGD
ncbi:MAG: imelysin family protein [Gammaproteobacteria bacterium]|nr:imelysin family protein [Gammaproteobacteria bacterium]